MLSAGVSISTTLLGVYLGGQVGQRVAICTANSLCNDLLIPYMPNHFILRAVAVKLVDWAIGGTLGGVVGYLDGSALGNFLEETIQKTSIQTKKYLNITTS